MLLSLLSLALLSLLLALLTLLLVLRLTLLLLRLTNGYRYRYRSKSRLDTLPNTWDPQSDWTPEDLHRRDPSAGRYVPGLHNSTTNTSTTSITSITSTTSITTSA